MIWKWNGSIQKHNIEFWLKNVCWLQEKGSNIKTDILKWLSCGIVRKWTHLEERKIEKLTTISNGYDTVEYFLVKVEGTIFECSCFYKQLFMDEIYVDYMVNDGNLKKQ